MQPTSSMTRSWTPLHRPLVKWRRFRPTRLWHHMHFFLLSLQPLQQESVGADCFWLSWWVRCKDYSYKEKKGLRLYGDKVYLSFDMSGGSIFCLPLKVNPNYISATYKNICMFCSCLYLKGGWELCQRYLRVTPCRTNRTGEVFRQLPGSLLPLMSH